MSKEVDIQSALWRISDLFRKRKTQKNDTFSQRKKYYGIQSF